MGFRLRDAPVRVSRGGSAIAPVEIVGLPDEIRALGRRFQRKVEFHMTVIGAAVIEEAGGGDPATREQVARVVADRSVGPIFATRELRHVRHPDEPDFQTVVVLVECPALPGVYGELSAELGVELTPLPAHVTLYSTDPEDGIGLNNEQQLHERAAALGEEQQQELRRAMRFEEVFGDPSQQ